MLRIKVNFEASTIHIYTGHHMKNGHNFNKNTSRKTSTKNGGLFDGSICMATFSLLIYIYNKMSKRKMLLIGHHKWF